MFNFQYNLVEDVKNSQFCSFLSTINFNAQQAVYWLGRRISQLTTYLTQIPLLEAIMTLVNDCFSSLYQTKKPKEDLGLERCWKKIQIDPLVNEENDCVNGESPVKNDPLVNVPLNNSKDLTEIDLLLNEPLEEEDQEEQVGVDIVDIDDVPNDFSPIARGDISTQREATVKILTTPGLTITDREGVLFKEFIVDDLWTITSVVTKSFPHAIGLEAIKEFRDLDFEQYIALKLKRFGHTFSLKGNVSLPSGSGININFEGFQEVFVVPMQVACYDLFAKQSKLFTKQENQWLSKKFNHTILSDFDYITPKEVEDMVVRIHAPNFVGPECIGTGFKAHSAGLIIFGHNNKLYLLFCDRSGISTDPGIYVFSVPDRSFITEDFINEISKRSDIEKVNYSIENKFMTDLGATVVYYEPLPGQDSGNCTLASMQTTFYALKTAKYILKTSQIDQGVNNLDANDVWKLAFEQMRPEHVESIKFDEQLVFDDFMKEVEEWIENPFGFGSLELRKTYQEALTIWLAKFQFNPNVNHQSVNRVQTLLNFLECMSV